MEGTYVMMQAQLYELYRLDMFHAADGWEENARDCQGKISIHADPTDREGMKVAIFNALQYEGQLLPTAKLEAMSWKDLYATGNWLEITFGDEEENPPLFGLSRLETTEDEPEEDGTTVADQWRAITANMPRTPEDSKWGFWYDEVEDEILTRRQEDANTVANFLADVLGEAVQTGCYDELDGIPGSAWYITID